MTAGFRSAYLETDASVDIHRPEALLPRPLYPAGAGIVLRDITLRPLLHKAVPLGLVRGPFHAEFLAFVRGLEEAAELGFQGVWATSDNLPLVGLVREGGGRLKPEVQAIHGEYVRVRAKFRFVTLRWSPGAHRRLKFGGPSADALARAALGLGKRN
ncbi:MAG: ribonuclease H family protein [Thermoplasmata archaeon]